MAIELKTGKVKWYYQYVHHDIWDLDNPCPPILADINVGGRTIKAVAQPTKQSFLYVLDRTTGKPVWPIEERPVPKGDVPGEWYSPTQPIPTKPPAYEVQGYSIDDLIDFTPELRAEAVKLVSRYQLGPVYTPPVVSKPNGPIATIRGGGSNWSGGSYDPETHILYVSSHPLPISIGLVPGNPSRTDMNYMQGRAAGDDDGGGGGGGFIGGLTVQGLPIVKPPYGKITAIDLNKGEILWQIAHGETADEIRDNPALKGLNIPRTGRPTHAGQLVTKSLLVVGERGLFTAPNGKRGAMLRAYDKATGKDAGAVYMPAPQSGSPHDIHAGWPTVHCSGNQRHWLPGRIDRVPSTCRQMMLHTMKFRWLVLGALLSVGIVFAAEQPAVYRAPRTPDGKPDLNGIWQAVNEANWNIEGHAAGPGTVVALGAEDATSSWESGSSRTA